MSTPQPIPFNGYFVQPPSPPAFHGTAPCRCGGSGVGPHVWMEGDAYPFMCKGCGEAGDGCAACRGEGERAGKACLSCGGEGVVPLGCMDDEDEDDGPDPEPPAPARCFECGAPVAGAGMACNACWGEDPEIPGLT